MFYRTLLMACVGLTTLAASHHDSSLGPIVQFTTSSLLCDTDYAFGLIGEVGARNYRVNGTLGYEYCDAHLFKVGAEILNQRLKYDWDISDHKRWVHQYSVGAEYSYLFNEWCFTSLDLGANASRAGSRWVQEFEFRPFEITNRIAGSDSYELVAGGTLSPWDCAEMSVAAVYDNVRYDIHGNNSLQPHHRRHVKGLGVSATFRQMFADCFNFEVTGEWRRPFDAVRGMIGWEGNTGWGNLGLGVFAAWTKGKSHLPDSNVWGLQIALDFGCCNPVPVDPCSGPGRSLLAWVRNPAVYVPEVLAIADAISTQVVFPQ